MDRFDDKNIVVYLAKLNVALMEINNSLVKICVTLTKIEERLKK